MLSTASVLPKKSQHLMFQSWLQDPLLFSCYIPENALTLQNPSPQCLPTPCFALPSKLCCRAQKNMFITLLNASWTTTRRTRQLHYHPGRMAVMDWSGSATHPSICTQYPCTAHAKSSWEIEMRRSRPTRLEGQRARVLQPNQSPA